MDQLNLRQEFGGRFSALRDPVTWLYPYSSSTAFPKSFTHTQSRLKGSAPPAFVVLKRIGTIHLFIHAVVYFTTILLLWGRPPKIARGKFFRILFVTLDP